MKKTKTQYLAIQKALLFYNQTVYYQKCSKVFLSERFSTKKKNCLSNFLL